jgi:hypothetical protein
MPDILEYGQRPQTDDEWLSVIATVQSNLDAIQKAFKNNGDTWTWDQSVLVWYATLAAELIEQHPQKAKRLQAQSRLELCH